jgi:hypothetical protein
MNRARIQRPNSFLLLLSVAFLALGLLATTGCNNTQSSTTTPSAVTIHGTVFGGQQPIIAGQHPVFDGQQPALAAQQPIVGAAIQLYAAGSPTTGGGYGQGATALISGTLPTTDRNGAFTITGSYALPSAASHFYIVATGGSPGNGNPVNSRIVLMAVIGDCTATSGLSSSLVININEVTTAASIEALQPFIAAPTGVLGAPVLIGAPSTAYNDLGTAFKTASTLANISTGVVVNPTSSNGQLLNTLADILAFCVNSNPGGDSLCSTLFTDATPSGSTAAADTVQAGWYIVQNPTNNVSALFGLITGTPPFVALSSAPATLAVNVPPTALMACFAVLGGSTVTNTGATVITGGDLALYPGTSVTGFPPGVVTAPAVQHVADSVALKAQNNLTTAYNYAAGLSGTGSLPADMANSTFTPGVYSNAGAVGLSAGTVTLDAQGDANAVFIFQIASTLTTSTATQVVLANGALADNVYWQVGTSATLGASSIFNGTIMANASITLGTGATLQGRALARFATVSLNGNSVTVP